jgi:hypothetical protein
MGDVLLNGRPATDAEVAAVERGRRCERDRDLAQLAGLLSACPREPGPGHVTDIKVDFAATRRQP